MDKRFLKNSESAENVCNDLGYKLIAFEPDWAITEVQMEVSMNAPVIWKGNMLGKHMTIPDEFMATIALLLGYDWQFEYQNTDNDLKESIKGLEILKGHVSSPTDIEMIAEKCDMCKDILDEIKESKKKDLEEYEERLKSLKFVLRTRQKLREWNNVS
jgi:hypothetical protein